MRYLSYVMYPLCFGGAIYSLLYVPHKRFANAHLFVFETRDEPRHLIQANFCIFCFSWYSWTIQSLVYGVYSFGFLLMLPQLFVNYRLKSVAHLPWRAFMYKVSLTSHHFTFCCNNVTICNLLLVLGVQHVY